MLPTAGQQRKKSLAAVLPTAGAEKKPPLISPTPRSPHLPTALKLCNGPTNALANSFVTTCFNGSNGMTTVNIAGKAGSPTGLFNVVATMAGASFGSRALVLVESLACGRHWRKQCTGCYENELCVCFHGCPEVFIAQL